MFVTVVIFAFFFAFAPFNYADPPAAPSCSDRPCNYPIPQVQPEPNFCSESFPLLGYYGYASLSNIKETFPNVQFFGPAKLPCHRIDFVTQEGDGIFPYPVPDDCSNYVWGSLMLLPMKDFEHYVKIGPLTAFKNCPVQLVQKPVEVKKDDKTIQGNAYVIELKNMPDKIDTGKPVPPDRLPPKALLNEMVGYYKEAGIPQCYIEKILNLPHSP